MSPNQHVGWLSDMTGHEGMAMYRDYSNHAGVPVTWPVAGVAMGLMLEEGTNFHILKDMLHSCD